MSISYIHEQSNLRILRFDNLAHMKSEIAFQFNTVCNNINECEEVLRRYGLVYKGENYVDNKR